MIPLFLVDELSSLIQIMFLKAIGKDTIVSVWQTKPLMVNGIAADIRDSNNTSEETLAKSEKFYIYGPFTIIIIIHKPVQHIGLVAYKVYMII